MANSKHIGTIHPRDARAWPIHITLTETGDVTIGRHSSKAATEFLIPANRIDALIEMLQRAKSGAA